MLVWDGETILEVANDVGDSMIAEGKAVSVGPFDGLRNFPSKEEMAAGVKKDVGDYATKDMRASRRTSKAE